MLPKVSRTFAAAIGLLEAPMESWVTTAYLLCRVVDTVEDAPDLDWPVRRAMFHAFEDALEGRGLDGFVKLADRLPTGDDGDLARSLPRVMNVLEVLPSDVVGATRRYVGEMTYGMALYARRHAVAGGTLTALEDERDLRRYCYFVAGTVGHLLTSLFSSGYAAVAARRGDLARHAEGFGLLLQMTNIVKDVTDDAERGWCFVPRELFRDTGSTPETMLEPERRAGSLVAVGRVADLARAHLDDAVRYLVTLPTSAGSTRRFCAFPMLLAARTLDVARGNLACVTPGEPVKVERSVVADVFAQVERIVNDDHEISRVLAAPSL